MKKLFTFGCSYTEDYSDIHNHYKLYKEFCGGQFPKTWPKLLSEKLQIDLENYGASASGNQLIFTSFCKNCDKIKKGDIVIVQWSFIERYQMSDENGSGWLRVGPGLLNHPEIISNECHERIIMNRTLKPYYDEIYDFENIIDTLAKSIGFEIYYWTIINELIYNQPKEILNQKKYLLHDYIKTPFDNTFSVVLNNGGKWIFEETNNQIKDEHMGKLGHEVQADLFYKHIQKFSN